MNVNNSNMDYQSIMRFQEKTYTPFGNLSTGNNSDINKRFQAQNAQIFLAQEKAKQEQIKADTKEPVIKPDTPAKKRVKKEKIPATLKNIVWHKYFETSLTGLCQCCKVENISKAIFDAGHIISEANGGQVVLDNLKPICKLCNSSMGKTNMDEFMKKYGI
jgi:hypothetical protein